MCNKDRVKVKIKMGFYIRKKNKMEKYWERKVYGEQV